MVSDQENLKQENILIRAVNLEKTYENDGVKTPVLFGVNLDIKHGEFVSIMGPSGSGKSTLMHILGFLDQATGGQYLFKGENVTALDSAELATIRNREVGFVFQAFFLLAKSTVLDNVLLPLVYDNRDSRAVQRTRALKAISDVGLAHRADFPSTQLSGGEKQRVAIARALVNNPSIIFADEPTGNLDSKSGRQVMLLLQELNDQGHTIVMVTHETFTAEHAKRIIRIRDGKISSDELVLKQRRANEAEDLMK